MPPGFMVDMRKTLPDGNKNEHYRKFVAFEPYAAVINEYFRLFLHYTGNVRLTQLHIHRHGPYYPDPKECLPPTDFRVVYKMQQYGNGYCPGRTALLALFTNAAYIGHWSVNRSIVQWNNHPGIVPVEIFMRAFNYLSPVGLDGQPNPNYTPLKENVRPSRDEKRSVERPICAGMLVSKLNGRWHNVGINWIAPLDRYSYVVKSGDIGDEYLWSKNAYSIDNAVAKLLQEKLRVTFGSDVWDKTLAAFEGNFEKEYKGIHTQRAALERVMERQVLSLETLTTADMIRRVEVRYEEAKAEHARLSALLASKENENRQLAELHALKETCSPALENWDVLTREEKRILLQAFIRRIEATPAGNFGSLHLLVYWRDGSTNEAVVRRQSTVGQQWTQKEIDQLLALADVHASQVEIAAAFPTRTWNRIRCKVHDLRGKGALRINHRIIYEHETYEMYLVRKSSQVSVKRADSGSRWNSEDVAILLDLIAEGVSAIEIATAFPQRTWRRIWAKVRALKGKDIVIPKRDEIFNEETITMYQARKAAEEQGNIVVEGMTSESVS